MKNKRNILVKNIYETKHYKSNYLNFVEYNLINDS